MLALQYSHRLPSDYDLQRIRQRARERGPQWDARPGLLLKAFVLRERGVAGADGNQYASIYLWQDSQAARDFLAAGDFRAVVDSFGRPAIEQWLPLGLARGAADQAGAVYREEYALGADEQDWAQRIQAEDAERARRAGVLLVWSVLDLQHWRHVRFSLEAGPLVERPSSHGYEVLHLARPGLERHP